MNKWLRDFEEFLLNNALLKMQNQDLADKNSKLKKWWQTI
jgi:hypothetical protein